MLTQQGRVRRIDRTDRTDRAGRADPALATDREHATGRGPGIYWMSRDQRPFDNWALAFAQELALAQKRPLWTVFCLAPGYPRANRRHYEFMLRGLSLTGRLLAGQNIPLVLLTGRPPDELAAFCAAKDAAFVVADFDPLRHKQAWLDEAARRIGAPLYEVDAHNVVPCRLASDKQEFAARTIRPKIQRLLPEYLTPFPEPEPHPFLSPDAPSAPDWRAAAAYPQAANEPGPVPGFEPGPLAAAKALEDFIAHRLDGYASRRNDPAPDGQSGLSPYFHFGQLAPQRAALDVMAAKTGSAEDKAAFLEELIIRRELSDNFCLHQPDYDALSGGPAWGLAELAAHAGDKRPFLYDFEVFEGANTHSALWNAAQRQLAVTGKMHGYMRMYWAKKILEWSESPQAAFETALTLNDRYSLDGRDPNGFTGVHWSITGLHDRPWTPRPVYGKIRYMNERGCRRKFDVAAYIAAQDAARTR